MKRLLYLLIFSFLTAGLLAGCAAEEETEEQKSDRVAVETFTARMREIKDSFSEVGELRASQKINLRARTDGELLAVNFEDGAMVEEGDVLFEIDDELLKQEVESNRQALEEVKSNLENARKTFERKNSLFQRGLAPRQVYDDAQAGVESLEARRGQLEAQLKAARENFDYTRLQAPFTGVVGENLIDEGEVVSPGQALVVLHRIDPMEVRFSIPEKYASEVSQGLPLEVRAEMARGEKFEGELTFISPEIDSQTRKLFLKGQLNNGRGRLKPGGFAEVKLVFETRENPAVPARALVAGRDGYSVYRIEEWLALRQPVETGLRFDGSVEITSGVNPGDLIVERGHESLSDKTSVRVTEGPSEED